MKTKLYLPIRFILLGLLITAMQTLQSQSQSSGSAPMFAVSMPASPDTRASGSSVTLTSVKDNSIYQQNQSNSNGAGEVMVAGNNGSNFAGRALLVFDVAGNIPASSTVTGVTLTLHCSHTAHVGTIQDFELHNLLEDWGEGTSDAGLNAGPGAPATTGDATWLKTFFPDLSWSNSGATFNSTASATALVGDVGFYSWSSGGMISDVQNWLDTPGSNFGWLLKGMEDGTFQARRFDAHENITAANRPVLTVEYTAPLVLTLTVFPEGLCNGAGSLNKAQDETGNHFAGNIADHITVELHDASVYSTLVYSAPDVSLSTTGVAVLNIPEIYNASYFITVKHRNSIATVSADPVSFAVASVNYSFDAPSKAFGNNLTLAAGGLYAIYGGDVNQDGIIDPGDMTLIDNLASTFGSGYIPEDVNGDGLMDSGDMTVVDNSATSFVSSITP